MRKLILGAPLYGYGWEQNGKMNVITEKQFYKMFKRSEYHHKNGVTKLIKPQKHGYTYLSIGDSKTEKEFLSLVRKFKLKGLAIWRLGFEK
ncbi:MAG: hypothetical protein PF637_14325 [Spirochaetes bacterium]|jgi:spore germination protein YaaH|nr:hypothetical protein [Spirochaetota bacterium]